MADPVTVADAAPASAPASTGEYDPLAGLNDGFLGTGHSTMVELSYIAGALVLAYVIFATAKYFLGGKGLLKGIGEAVWVKDD